MRIGSKTTITEKQIEKYAERWDFELNDEMRSLFSDKFQQQDELLTGLEDFGEVSPPDRSFEWATEEEDPLGAFITTCNISSEEDGALENIEIAIKDNIAVAGVPMTCGSMILDSFRPNKDATAVRRLLNTGATIVGKANMDEFAFGSDKSTMRYRLARNPRAPEHQPGGSSAGSGVAVANGDVDAALGTDTGGSVRFPAAWCGVIGIKPTRGLVSHDGFVQFSKTLDNVGTLARDTETAARVLQSIAGEDPRDERTSGVSSKNYLRSVKRGRSSDLSDITIGVVDDLIGKAPSIDERSQEAIEQLENNGAELRSVSIPSYEYIVPTWLAIGSTEIGAYMRARGQNYWLLSAEHPDFVAALDEGFRERSDELGPTIRSTILYAEHLTVTLGDEYYALATRARRQLTTEVNELFNDVDVLASTGVPLLPPKWGEEISDILTVMSNTAPFNITGHPAISLPCGDVDGLPTSLQVAAPHFDEETLFTVAAAYETISARE